jgi:hypothetical protein
VSLLRLAPECVRLRRLARAWAAGELAEHDYRAARREVIDEFVAVPPADDDTRRRGVEEPTLRRIDSGNDNTAAAPAAVSAPPRRWWWLLAALMLALTFVIATGAPRALAAEG